MVKYSFAQLEKKYSGFFDGRCGIDIEGFELLSKYNICGLTVQLSAMFEASYAEFTVFSTSSVTEPDSALAQKLRLGRGVNISLGYGSRLSEVFCGYIDSVRMEYGHTEGYSYTVTCLDGKGLMMNSARSEIKTSIKRYSDAVKKTLSAYSGFFSIGKIQQTPELTLPFSQLGESDYDFVVRLAKRLNYSFYISLGKAYFVPVGSDRTELMEISPQIRLKKFSLETTLKNRLAKVVVVNNDETNEKKQIKSEASSVSVLETGSSSRAAANSAIKSGMVKTISDPAASTNEAAKLLAQAELDRLSYSSVEGSAQFAGIPEVLPGKFAAITGFGRDYDRSCYITRVTHRIYGGDFSTTVEFSGNKL